ncbi:C39 family peptidase [Calothrix sp. FACHB-1219]|uniref:C39 family peptidase n=1 Tax=unclassified Calothrix TaxID=2619626 RepID=UPI001685F1B0|nr:MULTISPECIES: C39 family peptidase [unclassified Calothrix]MBD2207430.1 C39 family peptidase [Calothrix sp. FACHB-168]MBD2222006.1 C39 family peptidase [Calothrix sp. FACHB-1219]
MFANGIFSILDEWLDLDHNLQQEDTDNFGGDKNPSSSGDREPPKTLKQADDNYYLSADAQNYNEWLASDDNWHPSQFDGWGNPIEDAQYWQKQQGSNSCAVVAQVSVLESITGIEISEAQACQVAEANGWFDPETGTTPEQIGKFLEHYGVPCEKSYNASLEDIADALEKGDKVIVGLDAHEIWNPLKDPMTGSPLEQANGGHAVWVTGIDTEPDGSVRIILNDSGTPNGQMKVVDAEDFLNAWEDYGNLLVVADSPEVV